MLILPFLKESLEYPTEDLHSLLVEMFLMDLLKKGTPLKKINKKLPNNYSYGKTLDNPNENCHNCKFYVETKTGDYCSQGDADVRDEYWCKKWQIL